MTLSLSGRSKIPSTSLLRFLRSQTKDFCHPTPNTSCANRPKRSKSSFDTSCAKLHTACPSTRCKESPKAPACVLIPGPGHAQFSAVEFTGVGQTRHASTDSRAVAFMRKIWWNKYKKASKKMGDQDFPAMIEDSLSMDNSNIFNISRSLSRSPGSSGADQRLRCTEFNADGKVTLVSGEFKKSELIAKYGLLPRDLRKIDSSLLPHILVRPSAILINLLHLRVLIQADRVLVFDAYGSADSYTQSVFMYDLEGKLRHKSDRNSGSYLPYEFRALEAVLISVTSGLESEFVGVREPVVRVLRELEEDIDREKLRHLLIHSKKLGTFEQKARLVRDAINDLLDADDDLATMYLTERSSGKKRDENDHQEIEMLLESYHKICDEIVEISGNLISNIRNTEEVIKAILDANRNSLMLLELKFSIWTLGLGTGTLIAGLYGMNLKNFIEESDVAFTGVTLTCFGLSALVCMYGMKKLRKVQRVRMWGEGYQSHHGSQKRGNWRNEAIERTLDSGLVEAVPGETRAERIRRVQRHRDTMGAKGPVLWPGMEGLKMESHQECPVEQVDEVDSSREKEAGGGKVEKEKEEGPLFEKRSGLPAPIGAK